MNEEESILNARSFVEINKENQLLLKLNQELLRENQQLKEDLEKSIKVQIKTNKILIELEKLTKNFFQGKTIEDIAIDDYYNKGKYRMVEWFLDKINELKGVENDK